MSAIITEENLAVPQGDINEAGLTIKADGTFVVWNTFENPSDPSPELAENMAKILAFAAALRLPQIMDVLHQVANDPAIFNQAINVPAKH